MPPFSGLMHIPKRKQYIPSEVKLTTTSMIKQHANCGYIYSYVIIKKLGTILVVSLQVFCHSVDGVLIESVWVFSVGVCMSSCYRSPNNDMCLWKGKNSAGELIVHTVFCNGSENHRTRKTRKTNRCILVFGNVQKFRHLRYFLVFIAASGV